MKKHLINFTLLCLLISCSDPANPDQTSGLPLTASQSMYQSFVGKQIPGDQGRSWIERYVQKNQNHFTYLLPSKNLMDILSSKECAGISFTMAVDTKQRMHALPLAVATNGALMQSGQVMTDSTAIDWKTSGEWVASYQGEVRSYFFGRKTFDRLISQKMAAIVKLELAVSDDDKPQLLLSDGNQTIPSDYEDDSFKCPSFCPTTLQ
jgi:hypothetical protein